MQTLRRTPLYERHAERGARLVPFAGWEMPVHYGSIIEEHRAVRGSAGVFDVSHMGQLELRRPGSHDYLQARLSNDLDRIQPGGAQYALVTNEHGGVVDDLIAYRMGEDEYLLVVNAANVELDLIALSEAEDVSSRWALLAVQGPEALDRIEIEIDRFTFREGDVLGVRCLIAGTGYTGEEGCELGCAPSDAPRLWDALTDRGIVPCGLGARDSLRIEAAYPLHGNDISPERTPIEADLAFACALEKQFPGVEILRWQQREGTAQRLVALVMEDAGIPRRDMAVLEGGVVTSGTYSPMLDVGIGLAYVRSDLAQPGARVTVDLRGRERAARIVSKPIFQREE